MECAVEPTIGSARRIKFCQEPAACSVNVKPDLTANSSVDRRVRQFSCECIIVAGSHGNGVHAPGCKTASEGAYLIRLQKFTSRSAMVGTGQKQALNVEPRAFAPKYLPAE